MKKIMDLMVLACGLILFCKLCVAVMNCFSMDACQI